MKDGIHVETGLNGDRLLRKRELAAKLGIAVRTLDGWLKKGRVPHLKLGKSVRFHWPDVLAKLQTFRVN